MNDLNTIVEQNPAAPAEPAVKTCKCEKCQTEFAQATGRGRPRKFCITCRPPRAKPAKQE